MTKKFVYTILLALLFLSFFSSCSESSDDLYIKKEYNMKDIVSKTQEELKKEYPELNKKIFALDESISFTNLNELQGELQKISMDKNIKSFMLSYYDYMQKEEKKAFLRTKASGYFTDEQQACLDTYSQEMREARRDFIENCFLITPILAVYYAKREMLECRERLEICMAHA